MLILMVLGVTGQHKYAIEGYLESGVFPDSVYLQLYENGSIVRKGAKVENRKFELHGTTMVQMRVSVKVKGWRRSQELYVEPEGKYLIRLNEDWGKENVLIGGQENAIHKAYESDSKAFLDSMQILGKAYEKATDEERIGINELLSDLNNKWGTVKKDYIRAYPHSLAMLDVMRPQFEVMNFNQLEEMLQLFSNDLHYAPSYQELLKKYESLKKERLVGAVAPAIVSKTVTGEEFNLSQLRGKIVLLDFWASWCTPCRVGNKKLKPVYEKYKNKGFEIVSFSMDDKENLWKDAIEKDGIPWIQISDLMGLKVSKTAQDYHIRSLPTMYLIDASGQVIAQNIGQEELVEMLEAKLK